MSQRKVVYIISDIDKAMAFEWVSKHLNHNFRLSFVLIGKPGSRLSKSLLNLGNNVIEIKSPNTLSFIPTFIKVLYVFLNLRPQVIHTHLIKANLIGLTAGWLLKIKKRIYTRHHALVHHHEHKQGLWMDKWCNYVATDIIAISENVKQILIELDGANPEKVHLIHHGFDLEYFGAVNEPALQRLKTKLNLNDTQHPVVGVVARYQQWKGIQYIIPAFKKLLNFQPGAHLILANAHGSYEGEIKKALQDLPTRSYSEILFEADSSSLFKLFDIYVHVPVDPQSEAFGQTYVEALASGIPCVFTLSGVAPEFIVHEENALVVPFSNPESIYQSIRRLLEDTDLKSRLIMNGKKSANLFPLSKMISQLEQLYEQ